MEMIRDFTYIDDIIESIYRVIKKFPLKNHSFNKDNPNASISWAPYKILILEIQIPTPLMIFIKALENIWGKRQKKLIYLFKLEMYLQHLLIQNYWKNGLISNQVHP